jgi:hypothetical protein
VKYSQLDSDYWWRVKDLNLRRQSRGIYRPLVSDLGTEAGRRLTCTFALRGRNDHLFISSDTTLVPRNSPGSKSFSKKVPKSSAVASLPGTNQRYEKTYTHRPTRSTLAHHTRSLRVPERLKEHLRQVASEGSRS